MKTQPHLANLAELAEVAMITLPKRKESPGPGWWINRDGGATHVADIKEYEKLREETLRPLLENHLGLYLAMADHKARLSRALTDLVDVCWQEHGVALEGEKKKGMTLRLFDGSMSIRRVYRDRTAYDESIGAAEELVRQFLKEKTSGIPEEIIALIDSAFTKNKEGDIRRSEMVRLRRHNFDDERWQRAMSIIAQAEVTLSQACYFTVLIQDERGADQPLPLDLASIKPHLQPTVRQPRPIRTDEDHAAALAEVKALMDLNPAPDSPEGERLEMWVVMTEAYERKRWPMEVANG